MVRAVCHCKMYPVSVYVHQYSDGDSQHDRALAQSSVPTELKVYINGDGADVYEDRFFSLATAENARFTPTLILVGIRLGIDRVTPAYWEALKASLQISQSVGIAG